MCDTRRAASSKRRVNATVEVSDYELLTAVDGVIHLCASDVSQKQLAKKNFFFK